MDSTIPIPMWNAVSNIFVIISENKKLKRKYSTCSVKYAEYVTTG